MLFLEGRLQAHAVLWPQLTDKEPQAAGFSDLSEVTWLAAGMDTQLWMNTPWSLAAVHALPPNSWVNSGARGSQLPHL